MDSDEQRKARQLLKEKESGSQNLDWMYKEDGKPDTEDYLMGKRISALYDDHPAKSTTDYKIEQFSEQITHQAQLDMQAKMREDPLFAIRKREDDAKRKLLDNPVKMKQLQKLVDEQQKKKNKKKKHKKHADEDDLLKRYMQILKHKKKSEKNPEKQKHKDKHRQSSQEVDHKLKSDKKQRRRSSSEGHERRRRQSGSPDKHQRHPQTHSAKHRARSDDGDDDDDEQSKKYGLVIRGNKQTSHRRRSNSPARKQKSKSPVRRKSRSPRRRSRSPRNRTTNRDDRFKRPRSKTPPRKLTAEEKQRRLEEMTKNAKWRDEQRSQNVKRYKDEDVKDQRNQFTSGKNADFISPMMAEHASKSSVEERIKRNKFNLQRTRSALDGNFTKH